MRAKRSGKIIYENETDASEASRKVLEKLSRFPLILGK